MAKKDKDSDLALVRRVKKGEYSAFDLLVLKYQSRVIAISTKYVKDIQLAEDIAQESFFKAYKSIDSFREESAFYTWLYRITANTAINYLSSKKRKSELLEADVSNREGESIDIFDIPGGESPEDILNANSLREDIFKNMSNLPEEIRTAVTLREFEGLSYEEIAEILGCPLGTVRSRIFRGRELLQQTISEQIDINKKSRNYE
ncbi:MAG: sigma-70 family RNA polymerase sigma factor [Pseudomonadota bacterium]|jgi:RNA polymerase sigma-70 factor (ECF subfamily)|nr:RNA polymerase sigma factor RpoE [Gammaproteobacteria bacterium]MEC7917896.1 sigma-70 family RNA polymerase sigma factor [Pseudomonadota bacterium]|tara:strand:+ start:185 stop:796 length:612 start_codon:yes stop_codon:yes gene_type:complete